MSRSTTRCPGRRSERQPLLPVREENYDFFTSTKKYSLIPYPSWIAEYQRSFIQADLVGAITVASLYIPLCFSFATIAHVPPSSSLYAFVFHPMVYALLGSSPLMIVGPEATGSLLIGAVVKHLVDEDGGAEAQAIISGIATAMAGLMLCGTGVLRLGFVDNILSRPLMKGFIAGVGLTLVIEQVIPGLGLHRRERESGADDGPPLAKLYFLLTTLHRSHLLSGAFSLTCLICVVGSTHLKKRFGKARPWLVLFPERFIIILVSAFLTRWLELDKEGLQIVGAVDTSGAVPPVLRWPFQNWSQVRPVAGTSLFIALMGYFESSVTAKSILGPSAQNPSKPNRELAALGIANFVGGCFATLPAFGGFGRSKLNAQAGGKTPMASIFLGLISLLCALFISPYLYYVPKPTLSAMSCAVGISMLQECQHDMVFFWSMRAYRELALMVLVASAMFLNSMELGVEVGLGLTLFIMVHSATCSRAHSQPISDQEESFGDRDHARQYASLRLGETLAFTNVGGVTEQAWLCLAAATPSRCLLLDCQNVQEVDICSLQVLAEMISSISKKNIKVEVVLPGLSFPRARSRVASLLDTDATVHLKGSHFEAATVANSLVTPR